MTADDVSSSVGERKLMKHFCGSAALEEVSGKKGR
jgi:hypothetical protein